MTFERNWRNLALILALLIVATAPASSATGAAPADRYFGRMRMSYLGLNNTFKDAAHNAGDYTTASGIANKVDFAMESLNDWESRYPRDPQLARSYFLGQIALKKIWIKKYQDKAWAYMQLILAKYPHTFFGKTVKADLVNGFTQHYFAEPVPCGSAAAPAAPATINNGKYKIVVETPPCVPPTALPSAAPSAMPSPAATATP
ncbi:MAG TPA: hypothetical protein VGI19_09290 [Candidatus Cybelea sp.]